MHDPIRILEIANHAVLTSLEVRLSGQVSAEEQTGTDLMLIQMPQQIDPCDTALWSQRDRKAEPRRVAAGCRLGQDEMLRASAQLLCEVGKIGLAPRDEFQRLVELSQSARGLHVGDLQVIAGVRVGVLVIVALGKGAELPVEPLLASVVVSWRAEAVAAPVAEGFGDRLELAVVGKDRPALAHGDVVRGIETQGTDVAEGANELALVGRSQGVAAVLDEPEVVRLAQPRDDIKVEGVA